MPFYFYFFTQIDPMSVTVRDILDDYKARKGFGNGCQPLHSAVNWIEEFWNEGAPASSLILLVIEY